MSQGIYKIVSSKSEKCYVGSSRDIEKRWEQHCAYLKSKKHHSAKFQDEYNQYGKRNFHLETLEIVTSLDNLQVREQHWIEHLSAFTAGLNSSPFANRPRPMTPEEIRELCDKRLGLPYVEMAPPPKSGKAAYQTGHKGLFGFIKNTLVGPITVDPRTVYEQIADMCKKRLAVIDTDGSTLVEFYMYTTSVGEIWSGREIAEFLTTPIFAMVDSAAKRVFRVDIVGEDQIRRWLRQNSLSSLRSYRTQASRWFDEDDIKQSERHRYRMTRGLGFRLRT